MATDWCICNIGTGHSRTEPDNILVRVFHAVEAGKINDGPGHRTGDLLGNVFGHGLGDRLDESVKSVPADAARVFIVGHSRGAILSYLIANALEKKRSGLEVHIFNIDPVARYASATDDKGKVGSNVRSITALVMENDNMSSIAGIGNLFQLTFVQAPTATSIDYIPMPGTHGSATQVKTGNPIGLAAFQMVLRWLAEHDVPLKVRPIPARGLNETFFEIHNANPALGFTPNGAVAARAVTDWDSKTPTPTPQSSQNRREMLATGGITNPQTGGGGDKFTNSAMFVNRYHADVFRESYRASSDIVMMTPAQISSIRLTPGARASIRGEISAMQGQRFTWKTMTALGMANRLERVSRNQA